MKASKVAVVDYRTSNLLSIVKALQKVGAEVEMTQDAEVINNADRVVLPGVGAFGAAMRNIESLGLREVLCQFGRSGKPLIGICLGMQLMFDVSYEQGKHAGLGLVHGDVVEFPSGIGLKVPHMGWNQVGFRKDSTLFHGTRDNDYAYFVHSYYVRTDDSFVAGSTDYGIPFPAVVESGNIFGIQFHPEKSQNFGLKILENFLRV